MTSIDTPATTVADLPLDRLDPDPGNRPSNLDGGFCQSIAQHGVLTPILVTPTGEDRYRIIAGERRYRAALDAGHTTIPAVIRPADDHNAVVWQAVENLSRTDLNPSQEARRVARIMAAGMKQKALAATLDRPLSWVRARLALAALPDAVRARHRRGQARTLRRADPHQVGRPARRDRRRTRRRQLRR